MKVNAIAGRGYTPASSVKANSVSGLDKFNQTADSKVARGYMNYTNNLISFTAKNASKEQVIFIGAESDPWSKAGGVGTVMKDYRSFGEPKNRVEITPYYGGESVDGEIVPLQDKDGNYIMHTGQGDIQLELVAKKNMQWGRLENEDIALFRKKDDPNKESYFIFVDSTAAMKKPYADNFTYKSGAKSKNNGWNGDSYAKFDKAAVELLPELLKDKEGFNPATIICSDAQTAYTIEYMAKKSVDQSDDNPYIEIKPTYVAHNMGPGYCGETSTQNMFVNLGATPEQIELIENDPLYKQGLLGDNYFKPFVEKTLDETGTASAIMLPINYAKDGYVPSITTVSEDYAESLATNPQVAPNIYSHLKELYTEDVFSGILNPLNDVSLDPTKKLPNARYNEDCTDTDGKVYEKFALYPANPTYEEMRKIKNENKLKFFERLNAKDTTIITGNPNKTCNINPEAPNSGDIIKPELLEMIRNGKGDQVPLFVSWGRIDTQKGHDITLNAFEKFAKTKKGKNAVLVLGAGLDGGKESKIVSEKVASMLKDPDLKGRIVHLDGWAPAYAMSSAADAAIFSSRFEPCGLTDLEAMKYYCTPIVANTQGLKQKNFDPRNENEKEKATSFKTTHEFDLLKSQVELIIDAYVNKQGKDEAANKKVQEEFPTFFKTGKKGEKVYNDELFKDFAKNYKEYIDEKAGNDPDNYDWDDLSKDYSFRYSGFARELKDGVVVSELNDAINAFANADTRLREKMFKNIKNLETGWKTNALLHPNNVSSYKAYEDIHLMKDYNAPTEDEFNLQEGTEFIDETISDRQDEDIKSRVRNYTIASLTGGVAGILASRLKKAGVDTASKETDALKAQIKNLEASLAHVKKLGKRNVIIAAAVSSAATALLSLGIAHLFKKNREAEIEEAGVKIIAQPATPTPAKQESVSMASYINSIGK